jgi:prephenate dehydratase
MLFILLQNGGYAYVPSDKTEIPKTSLVFALKEEVGTLHEALKVFKVGIILSSIYLIICSKLYSIYNKQTF